MNYLIFGDLHINKQDLPEVKEVLDEIYLLKVKHNVGKIFILGDSFDKINPSSIEIDMLVEFLVKCDVPIVLIAADSHESTSRENSIVNHFGVLNSKIEVVKEWTDNRMFCGHFTLTESKINFGATRSKREFESYKYVFLGHQHTWELIPRNICQVGACRYIDFLEKADKAKVVTLVEYYGTEQEKVHFLGLKSPYKMIEWKDTDFAKSTPEQGKANDFIGELRGNLNKLSPKSKVKLIFTDFDRFRQFIPLEEEYKNKFFQFKIETDMAPNLVVAKQENIKTLSLKESLQKYLDSLEISDEIKKVILEIL